MKSWFRYFIVCTIFFIIATLNCCFKVLWLILLCIAAIVFQIITLCSLISRISYCADFRLKSLTLEATPLATQFFKRSYKISNNPGLWASLDALSSFAAWSKIRHDFTIWNGFKIEVAKNLFNKKCALKILFPNEKKIKKIGMIFDIDNSLWKSNFRTLWRAGKARQSIPGRL